MKKQGLSFIQKLIRFLGTRNVRLQSRGLPKGMGQTRQGTVKKVRGASGYTDPMKIPSARNVMGGGRIFTPSGGGKSKFMTKGSTYGHTRGTKIAATGTGGGALIAGAAYTQETKAPSGPATAGQKQFNAVQALRNSASRYRGVSSKEGTLMKKFGKKVPAWHGDVASWSKTGYHKFKKGSKSAKAFQQSYALAKKTGAKEFTWALTGKRYNTK